MKSESLCFPFGENKWEFKGQDIIGGKRGVFIDSLLKGRGIKQGI